MKKQIPILIALLLAFEVNAHVILHDSFDADLRGINPNTNVNLDAILRQRGGSMTTSYTETNISTGDALLQQITGGSFEGQTVLRLLTLSTNGNTSSTTGVRTDTNFANALAGKKYAISFSGAFEMAGAPSSDFWGSFYITDGPSTTPNGPTTRYAFLFRERSSNNLVFYKEGTASPITVTDQGSPYFRSSQIFTFNITVDEKAGVVDTVINQGQPNEHVLPQRAIEFGNSSHRYFGFRANQAAATGLVDLLIDDFKIVDLLDTESTYVDIPESSAYPLLIGIAALALVLVRRRR
ncbi:MAG: hypothetical protein EA353_00595 [Puniceicoccaceae bacterium]|nr:MAG: hypothetical protein EA353_00595 [Puniceicoccaceae bacterium]